MKTRYDSKMGSYHLDYSDELIPFEQIIEKVRTAIAEDTEGKLRRALIELGWTPPEGAARPITFPVGERSTASE